MFQQAEHKIARGLCLWTHQLYPTSRPELWKIVSDTKAFRTQGLVSCLAHVDVSVLRSQWAKIRQTSHALANGPILDQLASASGH